MLSLEEKIVLMGEHVPDRETLKDWVVESDIPEQIEIALDLFELRADADFHRLEPAIDALTGITSRLR